MRDPTPTPPHALRALVLDLVALNGGSLPPVAGELAHAAFYAIVDQVDPALSRHMHDAQGRSAFALSPLQGFPLDRGSSPRRLTIQAGQQGWLRICLLDDQLFQAFQEHLLRGPLPTIRLGEVQLAITQVYGAPGSHPWCGYTTMDSLRRLHETPTQWTLEFASPTAIRWGQADNRTRRVEVFPMPRLAVAGLRTRWDRLTGDQWGLAFEEWVERNVTVSAVWRWQTQNFPFQRQSYRGGVGRLAYRVLDPSHADYVAHFNRLLTLAFYTGIGYKTTHGLGMVRVVGVESGVRSPESRVRSSRGSRDVGRGDVGG